MPTTPIPYPDPGQAAFENLGDFTNSNLLMGHHPGLSPAISLTVANAQVLEQFHVVGKDGSGNLVPAVNGGGSPVQPIGITIQSITGDGSLKVGVFYTGNFDMDALVWDASYATDADKANAFNGSPTPTNIIVGKR